MSDLARLQREFFRALLLPLRGSSRASTDLQASEEGHSKEFFAIADDIIKPGPSLTSAERLELYHRQYWFRILDSLAEDFPVLRRMAGEETFWNLIEAYLLARPSKSHTLRHLGEAFAGFIGTSDLLDGNRKTWFQAIATLEYAHMECFESAQSALPSPDDLSNGVIELQDHVKLLRLPVPADLCRDWPEFSPPASTDGMPVHIAVWREPSGRSRQERVSMNEAPLLLRLRDGIRLDELFDLLPEPAPSEEEITAMFSKWQTYRWLGVKGRSADLALDPGGGWEGMDRMSSQAVPMQ